MTRDYPTDPNCIFCRILAREAPATFRYETDEVFAFDDHHPHAPTHVLLCPKAHYPTFMETPPEVLAILGAEIQKLAKHLGCDQNGFRLMVNNGRESGQIVFHLHYHLLSGRTMSH
jgi:histidine triad (HIT) family protein